MHSRGDADSHCSQGSFGSLAQPGDCSVCACVQLFCDMPYFICQIAPLLDTALMSSMATCKHTSAEDRHTFRVSDYIFY